MGGSPGELAPALASSRTTSRAHRRGRSLSALGRAREAVPLYHRALELSPRRLEARNNLGNAYLELADRSGRRLRHALEIGLMICKLSAISATLCGGSGGLKRRSPTAGGPSRSPRPRASHNNLGLALAARGRRGEAAASFRRALSARGGRFIGCAAQSRRRAARARAAARRGNPGRISARPWRSIRTALKSHCHLGDELYEGRAGWTKRWSASAAHWPCGREYPLALVPLGLGGPPCAVRVRRPRRNQAARAAVALEPELRRAALSLLGDLHTDRGEFAKAQELYERALAFERGFCAGVGAARVAAPDDERRHRLAAGRDRIAAGQASAAGHTHRSASRPPASTITTSGSTTRPSATIGRRTSSASAVPRLYEAPKLEVARRCRHRRLQPRTFVRGPASRITLRIRPGIPRCS